MARHPSEADFVRRRIRFAPATVYYFELAVKNHYGSSEIGLIPISAPSLLPGSNLALPPIGISAPDNEHGHGHQWDGSARCVAVLNASQVAITSAVANVPKEPISNLHSLRSTSTALSLEYPLLTIPSTLINLHTMPFTEDSALDLLFPATLIPQEVKDALHADLHVCLTRFFQLYRDCN